MNPYLHHILTLFSLFWHKTVLVIRFQQLIERLGVEFVVAEVKRRVDRFEGLEIDIHFLFFPFLRYDSACVDDQSIGRHLLHEPS